jgi:tRNA uridine 5-carbamoylmethylation protein Kti12
MVTLVCGPPCAGKTTLAQHHAHLDPNATVLDFDAIAVELGSPHRWDHPKPIREQAEQAMQHRMHTLPLDPDLHLYVIRTAPQPQQRTHLATLLHAHRVWVVDPGYQVCIARCRADRRPRGTESAIRRWYDRYEPAPVDTPCPAGVGVEGYPGGGTGGRVPGGLPRLAVNARVTSRRW